MDDVGSRIREWLDGLGDPITLYRALIVGDPDSIDTEHLGRFWTAVRAQADSPFGLLDGKRGIKVVVQAHASRRAVDEPETIATMRRYPDEMEVRLIQGSPVVVDGYWLGSRFVPRHHAGRVASRWLHG